MKHLAQGHTASDWWSQDTWPLLCWTPLRCREGASKSRTFLSPWGKGQIVHPAPPAPEQMSCHLPEHPLWNGGGGQEAGICQDSVKCVRWEKFLVLSLWRNVSAQGKPRMDLKVSYWGPGGDCKDIWTLRSVKCVFSLSSEAGVRLVPNSAGRSYHWYLKNIRKEERKEWIDGWMDEWMNDGKGEGSTCVWVEVCLGISFYQWFRMLLWKIPVTYVFNWILSVGLWRQNTGVQILALPPLASCRWQVTEPLWGSVSPGGLSCELT